MTTRLRCAALVGLFAFACSDGGGEPSGPAAVPGALTLQLEAPTGSALGAVLAEITGELVSSATGIGDTRVFGAQATGKYVVAAFGELENGGLGILQVPDVGKIDDYSIRVTAAANRDNELSSTTALTVRLVR